ncbi:MAG TPA: maltotransferase domain-containing protein, partial [Polyangia bacterium]|nr:maltotransferase domain-containing protein [Polyangia bacterium]
MGSPAELDGRRRVIVDAIRPCLDGGRTAIKRVVGDRVRVEADLLADGHDRLAGCLRYRHASAVAWSETPLLAGAQLPPTPQVEARGDRDFWYADFLVDALGIWEYSVCGWVDAWQTWAWGLGRKLADGQDVGIELRAGADLAAAAGARAAGPDAVALRRLVELLRDPGSREAAEKVALAPETDALMRAHPDRSAETVSPLALPAIVEPVRARFSSWYE